jgi:hypothetical protein
VDLVETSLSKPKNDLNLAEAVRQEIFKMSAVFSKDELVLNLDDYRHLHSLWREWFGIVKGYPENEDQTVKQLREDVKFYYDIEDVISGMRIDFAQGKF